MQRVLQGTLPPREDTCHHFAQTSRLRKPCCPTKLCWLCFGWFRACGEMRESLDVDLELKMSFGQLEAWATRGKTALRHRRVIGFRLSFRK